MAYIGKTPVIGNFQKCDSISVVNGQAAYTLQVGGANVSPQSENHMLVSLNGILQSPVDSFTVSGSTLTFASNLVTGDVIDFVMILGNVLDLGVPSDNTVSLAKLTATGTKDATTFLRGDNTFAGAGITEYDQWRVTADFAGDVSPITSNLERVDSYSWEKIGTGMTESSGVFTFPSTGKYWIFLNAMSRNPSASGERNHAFALQITTDTGSNWNSPVGISNNIGYHQSSVSNQQSVSGHYLFDVTNTSTHQVRFGVTALGNDATVVEGDTNQSKTYFTFIKVGET